MGLYRKYEYNMNKQVKAVDGWNIEGLSNDFKMSR